VSKASDGLRLPFLASEQAFSPNTASRGGLWTHACIETKFLNAAMSMTQNDDFFNPDSN
jgi:hypothetical protein